jgi:hypothetical protein
MKRRRRIHRDIRQYAHPKGKMKQELTIFQLAAIGAVSIAYNELELAVDTLMSAVIGAPYNVCNPLSDMDANIADIAKGLNNFELEREDQKQIAEALDVLRQFTVYRNAIVNVRIINLTGGIMQGPKLGKGKSTSPFTDKALNIFYDHLIALEKEFTSAAMLIQSIAMLRSLSPDDPRRSSYYEGKRACCSQFRGYGMRRNTLEQIPWLPSKADLRDVKVKWQQALQAETMAWLTAWSGQSHSVWGQQTQRPSSP